jgi:hypothetical protein
MAPEPSASTIDDIAPSSWGALERAVQLEKGCGA